MTDQVPAEQPAAMAASTAERPAATVAALVRARAGDDAPGLRFGEHSWTWDEVVRESTARASLALEVREPGRPFHIGVLMENTPEYLFWIGGALLAGATIVGLNLTRRGAELARDTLHTDCGIVVTDGVSGPLLDGLGLGLPTDGGPSTGGGSPDGRRPVRILTVDGPDVEAALRPHRDASLSDLRTGGSGGPDDPSTLAFLVFTSGSTAAPKAVRWSSGAVARSAHGGIRTWGITRDDVVYIPMPLFHGNALKGCWAPAVVAGATIVTRRRFSASGFLPDVRTYGVTYFSYVGRALSYVLAQPPRPQERDTRLRLAFGTEAAPRDRDEFTARFGARVLESYGSSENGISLVTAPGMPPSALGVAPPGRDVVVLDPDTGAECPRAVFGPSGELVNADVAVGELASRRGAQLFEGYYGNEAAEAERVRDGVFWSGDLAYRDADGYFHFAGRASDRIRVDGENLAAGPIEAVLGRVGGVAAAVAYPVADPRTGDQVMATLQLEPGTAFDPSGFAAELAGQPDLATKASPAFVRVTPELPLTGTQKVDRGRLRREGWDCPDPVWWRPDRGEPYVRLTDDARRALRASRTHFHDVRG